MNNIGFAITAIQNACDLLFDVKYSEEARAKLKEAISFLEDEYEEGIDVKIECLQCDGKGHEPDISIDGERVECVCESCDGCGYFVRTKYEYEE